MEIVKGNIEVFANNADSDEGIFHCDLDDVSLKKAADELNEDDTNRDGAVQALRDWVKQQQPWLKSPTGTGFLMQYLRGSKFSQLEARRKLENSFKIRTEYRSWVFNRETTDANMQAVFKTGFLLRLPKCDKDGRIFLLHRPGMLPVADLKSGLHGGLVSVFRAMLCMLDWVSMDERSQVNGLEVIVDYHDFTFAKRSTLFTPTNQRKIMQFFQDAACIRIKLLHAYNPGPFFDAAFTLIKPFIKEKVRNRILIHGTSLVSLYKTTDKSVLPKEYLPDEYTGPNSGTLNDALNYTLEGLRSPPVYEYINTLSTDYGVNLDLKPDNKAEQASYRKLNVD